MTARTSTNKTASPDTAAPSGEPEVSGEAPREESSSAWIRYYETYPPELVKSMLEHLKHPYGIAWADYFDELVIIPTSTTIKVRNDRGTEVDRSIPTFVLYMSVAGRYKMLADISEAKSWRTEFTPEVDVEGVPGLIQSDSEVVVYRVTLTIYEQTKRSGGGWDERCLGSRTGVSKRPASDKNSFEKAETAASGRAIAAWGIGVLPGSGVASAEELRDAQAMERGEGQSSRRNNPGGAVSGNNVPGSRPEWLEETQSLTEQLRVIAGIDQEEAIRRNALWLERGYSLTNLVDQNGAMIWSKVKDGPLIQLRNSLRSNLAAARAVGDEPA